MFEDGLTIAKFTEINFPDKVLQIVGPQLLQELDPRQETPMAVKEKGVRCLIYVLNIGLCCTKTSPSERTSMQEVAAKLHGIRDAYLRGNGRFISYRVACMCRFRCNEITTPLNRNSGLTFFFKKNDHNKWSDVVADGVVFLIFTA